MPLKLQRNERILLASFLSVVLIVVVLVLIFSQGTQEDPGYPSSTSTHSNGALAAYLSLQESGYDIQRWYDPPSDLPSNATNVTLIIAEPFFSMREGEKTDIAKFISGGGRVLAIGPLAGRLLPRDGIQLLTVPRSEWKKTTPTVPSRISSGGPFNADQNSKWESQSVDEIVHFASDDGPAVASYRFGKGEVIWWASAVPIRNNGIREAGNLELLVNSIGGPGTRVYWDEYFHSSHHSLYAVVADTPLKFLGWQFLLFAMLMVATYSRRSWPLRPLAEHPRVSTLEFIETLGGLYHQFRTPGLAVEVAYDRFRHLLMRHTGVKLDAPPELVAKVIREKLRYTDDQLIGNLKEYQAARSNSALSNADALRMVREITSYQAQILAAGRTKGEH